MLQKERGYVTNGTLEGMWETVDGQRPEYALPRWL